MSEKPPSPEWPPEVSEEEKAQFLLSQAQQQKKRFGNLKAREKLPPHVSERDVVNRKLREGRAFFDSADYFRALQLGKNQVPANTAPSCIFFFRRDESGALVRNNIEPFSERLISQLVQPPGKHFDSADWALSLHGVLEYPRNNAHPILAHFSHSKDGGSVVAIVTHPVHEKALSSEQLQSIAEEADAQLRKKYGNFPLPTKNDVLKLKLKGHTPGTAREALFDSADWQLTLKSAVLPPPNYQQK